MEPFPKEHELISFFEGEPSLLEKGVPWAYNQLRFQVVVGEDRIVCEMAPGYEELTIRWDRAGTAIVDLQLYWVSGLVIEVDRIQETLVAKFRDRHLHDLRFRLRPHPHLAWSTNPEPIPK